MLHVSSPNNMSIIVIVTLDKLIRIYSNNSMALSEVSPSYQPNGYVCGRYLFPCQCRVQQFQDFGRWQLCED